MRSIRRYLCTAALLLVSGHAATAAPLAQVDRITPPHATAVSAGTGFGGAIEIDGDHALIVGESGYGAVYVYMQLDGRWTVRQRVADDAPDRVRFGEQIATNAEFAFISARRERETRIGIHRRDGERFDPVGTLEVFDGRYVGLSADESRVALARAGIPSLSVYRRVGDSWQFETSLPGETPPTGAIAIVGDRVAWIEIVPDLSFERLRIWSRAGGSWRQEAVMVLPWRASFPTTLAAGSSSLLVGVASSNMVVPYERVADEWQQRAPLRFAELGGALFGASLASDGDIAIAAGDCPFTPGANCVPARVLRRVEGEWRIAEALPDSGNAVLGIETRGPLAVAISTRHGALVGAATAPMLVDGTLIAGYGAVDAWTEGVATASANQFALTGAWFEPRTSGQGFALEIFPDLVAPGRGLLSGGWFTFDRGQPGGADRQRWYTIAGEVRRDAATQVLTIYRNVGGNFDAPPITTAEPVGSARISFTDCGRAVLDYGFSDLGAYGTIPLARLTPGVGCTASGTAAVDPDAALSGNWFAPASSGQGFIVDLDPASRTAFVTWYTYATNAQQSGAAGQRWYSAQGGFSRGQRAIPLELFETVGGTFDAAPTAQRTTSVGSATLTYASCTRATLSYTMSGGTNAGRSGAITLSRVGPAPPGCTF
jgi:hypothetical protein